MDPDMTLVSDNLLYDTPVRTPHFPATYPQINDFVFWNPNSWTKGPPHDLFDRMRSQAPVMWTDAGKKFAGFWSITGYDDIKTVELNSDVYSSERGSTPLSTA